MANQFQTLNPQQSYNRTAQVRALELINNTGKGLPCHVVAVNGQMVTVAFDLDSTPWTLPQLTIPKQENPYIKSPTQVGDKGMTVAAFTYLDYTTGQSGSISELKQCGNLSGLTFVPVGNIGTSMIDPDAVEITAPNGAIIKTDDGVGEIIVNGSNISLTYGATTFIIDSTGINITCSGQTVSIGAGGISFNGIDFATHRHTGVQTGGSNTGGPI